jgi:hypothetical protein
MSVVVNDDVITYGEIADRLAPTKKETKRDTILLTPKMKRLAASPAQLRAKVNLKGLLTSTACDLINMGLFGTFCFADEMCMDCHCKRHALAGGKVAKMT